ncbi:MAG: HD domain-containing phosphohydrolase [Fimbriimonadaceae bacterium]
MQWAIRQGAINKEQAEETARRKSQDSLTAVRLSLNVVLTFVLFAVFVIVFVDNFYSHALSSKGFTISGTVVGLVAFVLVSAILLYVAVWSVARELVTAKRRLRESEEELVRRLGQAAEWRDDETGDHTLRVGEYCSSIAHGMGLGAADCEAIKTAAMLHDIGKIGIPDFVMVKSGDLSAEERQLIQAHTLMGSDILADSEIPLIRMAQRIAASHHEKWDGSGYPYGLAGEAIPIEGRIAALADVFDALTSRRRYKDAWSFDQSVQEVICLSGAHFDPAVVKSFQVVLPKVRATYEKFQSTARLFNISRAA